MTAPSNSALVALLQRVEAGLRALLVGEHTSLHIGFNDDHAANYVTAQQWHDEYGFYTGSDEDRIDWVSEDERLKAIETNSVWTLQYYPNTPVGFNCIGASSLPAILRALIAQAPVPEEEK